MVDFSGCPGDSPNATAPNWVTCPWPPDFRKVLNWQWDEVVAPYWAEHAKFARRSRGEDRDRNASRICGLQSRNHAAAALDGRDRMWAAITIRATCSGSGIDPIAAIRLLGDAIFHVHAKDTQIYGANLLRTGVLDTKPYTEERDRAWIFRTCGYGHGAEWWSEFDFDPAHVRLRQRAVDRA